MEQLGLATQTMFAELLQRCLDAEFDDTFDERGNFVKKEVKGRFYWYHQQKIETKVVSRYVGPVTDPSITGRVERHAQIKSDFKGRREMVRALLAAGLPGPDAITGKVVEAMWKAGFFRLRGVLVGTVAYQTYAGLLGAKLTSAALQTQDADFAQFWPISKSVEDSMPPVIDVLRDVDKSFREVPNINDPVVATAYKNARHYKVEFLTSNRGGAKLQGRPSKMPALGGASAQQLRHLDYLIRDPERSVLLFGGGVPVIVPRAERYVVHKLIIAPVRENPAKARKDIAQCEALIAALAEQRPVELAEAWKTARDSGPRWKEKLKRGRARLEKKASATLDQLLEQANAA